MLGTMDAPWFLCVCVCLCNGATECVNHRVCVLNYKLLYKCAESRPGQSDAENIIGSWCEEGDTARST